MLKLPIKYQRGGLARLDRVWGACLSISAVFKVVQGSLLTPVMADRTCFLGTGHDQQQRLASQFRKRGLLLANVGFGFNSTVS